MILDSGYYFQLIDYAFFELFYIYSQ